MSTPGQRPSSSSRDLTLVVESESGTPEEFFAQVNISIGRAKSNTIHIDHPDVDHIHAKVVKREESFWLRCEGQARLQVLDPEPFSPCCIGPVIITQAAHAPHLLAATDDDSSQLNRQPGD